MSIRMIERSLFLSVYEGVQTYPETCFGFGHRLLISLFALVCRFCPRLCCWLPLAVVQEILLETMECPPSASVGAMHVETCWGRAIAGWRKTGELSFGRDRLFLRCAEADLSYFPLQREDDDL